MVLLSLLLGCPGAPPSPGLPPDTAEPVPPGNVLILLLDDIGVDKVGVYGAHPSPPPTPHIDALAEQGVRFRNAWAHPSCTPSRAALLTGRYGRRTGLGGALHFHDDPHVLPREEILLPELLQHSPTHRWRAEMVGKWHLATAQTPDWATDPLVRGFDRFAGTVENLNVTVLAEEPPGSYHRWEKNIDGALSVREVYATTDTVDDALARIDAMPQPWLLVVSFHAAHTPLSPPPDPLNPLGAEPYSSKLEVYDAIVHALDLELGRLVDGIPTEVWDRTTTVLVGDNGTPEHAIAAPWDPARAKLSPYEGGVRVPLIVTGPEVGSPGAVSDALVHIVDVFPTVAELAAIELSSLDKEVPGGGRVPLVVDGVSLLPHLADPSAPSQRAVLYNETFSPPGPGPYAADIQTVRDASYKLIAARDIDGREGEQLFALDPAEVDEGDDLLLGTLTRDQRDALDRLRDELDRLRASMSYEGLPAAR